MATMNAAVFFLLMVAACSAQTSIGPVVISPTVIEVSNGPKLVNVSCQFNIDGNDAVSNLIIQYGRDYFTDSVPGRQFRCSADYLVSNANLPTDDEFTSIQPLVLNGCVSLSFDGPNRMFNTQVATLWATIPISSVTTSRFWGGQVNNGTVLAGPVSEMNIIGLAPVLAIAQQPCTHTRDCIRYTVKASVMATPSVSMSLVCGPLTAENTISANYWMNQTLVVPITSPLQDFSCTASVDGLEPQMKTETIDYEAHSCPCEEYVINSNASPLSSCFECSGCTYKWYTDGTLVNGETGQNLSFSSYVTDVGTHTFKSETCDSGSCVNKSFCINASDSSTGNSVTILTQTLSAHSVLILPLLQFICCFYFGEYLL